ncbi:Molybdenum cofactor sulfurase [Phytophthora cactorum]|uniref:Molybdenum cofactor sulfurase n=1 Tax=Phytophthora cactorum TaxID=29920 RepID=A0A329S607_9STRA|nr:Molybdenum cofactor sulfurase [Phytophthora cactorum]KAG2831989.1 Molybdenum cofactor sulfurase [Phytophthora cactorum]KAG2834454.1 Molybdenum cofactor sulfurase [Phytophthora cactorum]KAG2861452.1 Molybdenum cofactor sulfurase [Phytophthora cactorum]KAG2917396.1 Molybdenum cofactor sulfurase [Phytophthora cactorum]
MAPSAATASVETAGETKSTASMSASKAAFVADSDGAYGYGGGAMLRIDEMRMNEFPHMHGSVYLDHAGATMYSKTQLDAAFQELQGGLFTNPHSAIGGSQVESTTAKIESVRRQVLAFFSASEKEYTLIFTSGATAALKLIGESFSWTKESTFAYSMDSHTSVLGIRGYAAAQGSSIACVGLSELEEMERVAAENEQASAESTCCPTETSPMSLFAFPAECNFSGVRHSLCIVDQIRAGRWKNTSTKSELMTKWFVLVDAAKYVGTHRLDLSTHHPDFVVLSFYKIFGYPTGLGALIVRKAALPSLRREYQGGGTVQSILAGRNHAVPRGLDGSEDASSRFADGTQSFLSILALRHGIEQVEKLGMANISAHTAALRALLVDKLPGLKHWNGRPVCEIYGKTDSEQQGPIVTCNYIRSDGSYVGYSEVHKLAEIHNIHLRTGCFCNPGACQHYLGLKESDLMSNIAAGHVCGDDIDVVNGLPTGAVRLSLGYMTTFEDIEAFVEFTSKYFVCTTAPAEVTDIMVPSSSISSRPVSKGPYLCKLTLFPIKSCAGMVVNTWPVGSRGLLFDREFAIVDESSGNALTLKSLPELCFLHPIIDLGRETLKISYRKPENLAQQSKATPSSSEPPPSSSFTIPLRADISTTKHQDEDNPRSMSVCTDSCKGRDVGADVSRWLSSCLGRQCALVRVSITHLRASQALRPTKKSTAKQRAEDQGPEASDSDLRPAPIGFANQAQYLLISRQSIAHFNAVLGSVDSSISISEDAFRANLIVDGCAESFEEDKWRHIRIGSTAFEVSGPCSRCSVINLDPHTGAFSRQPLQVLSSYRRQRSSIFFGQFLTSTLPAAATETVWLCVGDQVEVTGKIPL